VLTDGRLTLYVERGGRTLLSFTDDDADLHAAAHALAAAVRQGGLGRLTVQKADGDTVTVGAVGEALAAAGFHLTPRGLRLRPGG
jgi:ATP-dependent Lhr-like helicase